MSNLIILAGIPGCGKSTWARMLRLPIVSSDEIRQTIFGSLKSAHLPEVKKDANNRVFALFHTQIGDCLTKKKSVIADATNLTARSREELRRIAYVHNAGVHLVLFDNLGQALERNQAREEDAQVPPEVMAHMHRKYVEMVSGLSSERYSSVTRIDAYE